MRSALAATAGSECKRFVRGMALYALEGCLVVFNHSKSNGRDSGLNFNPLDETLQTLIPDENEMGAYIEHRACSKHAFHSKQPVNLAGFGAQGVSSRVSQTLKLRDATSQLKLQGISGWQIQICL